jgi:hypothetical protein
LFLDKNKKCILLIFGEKLILRLDKILYKYKIRRDFYTIEPFEEIMGT